MLLAFRPLNYLSLRWYKWQTDGSRQPIEPDNVKYLLTLYRRVLTIKNPVIDDSGSYECEAVFERPGSASLPPVSALANLTVLGQYHPQLLGNAKQSDHVRSVSSKEQVALLC